MPGLVASTIAGPSSCTSYSFNTLDRENAFRHPSTSGPKYPAPQALVAPHIHSFDALFEGAPLEEGGVSASEGLLNLAIKDLTPKVLFDGRGQDGKPGNKLMSSPVPFDSDEKEETENGEGLQYE